MQNVDSYIHVHKMYQRSIYVLYVFLLTYTVCVCSKMNANCDTINLPTELRPGMFLKNSLSEFPEAQFLVPDWGIKSTMAQSCRAGQPGYIGWRAGPVQPYSIVDFIPQSRTKNLAAGFQKCFHFNRKVSALRNLAAGFQKCFHFTRKASSLRNLAAGFQKCFHFCRKVSSFRNLSRTRSGQFLNQETSIYIRRVVGSKNFTISETVYDLARFLQNLSRLPKKAMKTSRFPGPNPLPLAQVMDLPASKASLDEPLQSANPAQRSSCTDPPVYIRVHCPSYVALRAGMATPLSLLS